LRDGECGHDSLVFREIDQAFRDVFDRRENEGVSASWGAHREADCAFFAANVFDDPAVCDLVDPEFFQWLFHSLGIDRDKLRRAGLLVNKLRFRGRCGCLLALHAEQAVELVEASDKIRGLEGIARKIATADRADAPCRLEAFNPPECYACVEPDAGVADENRMEPKQLPSYSRQSAFVRALRSAPRAL
jgi:hypothetical protein